MIGQVLLHRSLKQLATYKDFKTRHEVRIT